MNKKKLLIPFLAILIVLGGGAYTFAKPKPVVKPPKVNGTVYLLPQSFLCNLADGQYAKFSVALVLAPGQSDGATAEGAATNNAGDVLGTLPEEAVIRDIITNVITNQTSNSLINDASRTRVKQQILQQILSQTDVKVTEVLIPDVAIQ
jgi:flagellar FliL protein